MKNANFIAIDFETATPQRAACQIGIVVVKEGHIVNKISKLIQPPKNRYSSHCIKVHGITPNMTVNSPTFDIVWNEIKEYFEGNFVIAHNAAFDIDVLYKSLDIYNIPHPIFMGTTCTYQLSGMSLEDACSMYNISLCNHHDGICDAEACAQLFLKYLNKEICFQKIDKPNKISLGVKESDKNNNYKINKELLREDPLAYITNEMISSLTPLPFFQNKKFIITGDTDFNRERTYKIITSLGGEKASSVNKLLDYAIIGKEPGPKKIEKLEELIKEGVNIRIFTENNFVSFVKSLLKNLTQ